jgi:hypothetical protein
MLYHVADVVRNVFTDIPSSLAQVKMGLTCVLEVLGSKGKLTY